MASNRRSDAVALFLALVGVPAEQIAGMRQAPFWGGMEAIAPTLAYNHTAILGNDAAIPADRAARVRVPALVMNGGSGAPFMLETARTLSKLIPNATLRTLDGQTHDVQPATLAPVLVEFFAP
jgi:pimeloyl-ACP methyl ester carboxylesterase